VPPIVTVDPLPVYSDRDFNVSWSGSDQGDAGIGYYDVQYQVNGGNWSDWQTGVTITNSDFVGAVEGRTYAFRARGVDNVGNVEAYGAAEAQTLVDTHEPIAIVNPLPGFLATSVFTVTWSRSDSASGIQYYDVRYRYNGGNWLLFQNQTLASSAPFSAVLDGLYEFEARAVDNSGLVEAFTGQPEAGTIRDLDPPFIVPQMWLPIIGR
jgi:hypothetical protein